MKFLKLNNSSHRESGASLNLFRYAAMVLVLLMVSMSSAWAGTTTKKYYYYAKVTATSTGNGYVYASTTSATQDQATSPSLSCGPVQDNNSYSSLPANGQVTFYLSAKPQNNNYKFDGWSESSTRPSSFLSTSETYPYTVSIPAATSSSSNPGGTANATTSESNFSGDETLYYSNTVTKTLYAYFSEKKLVNITFIGTETGSYKSTISGVTNTVSSSGANANNVEEVLLSEPIPASGYVFAGWYQINTSGTILDISNDLSKSVNFSESGNVSIGARFVSTSTPKFKNISTSTEYYGLKAALSAAVSGQTIIPVAEETVLDGADLLPADNGTYTIPAGVTLLVPYNTSNSVQTKPVKINETKNATAITIYKKLKFTEGVNIVCNGTICVGGQACAGNGGNPSGYVTGACGFIDMSAGGHIELNNGSTLYCWGFIKGQDMDQGNNTQDVGTITANSGSTIWEDFATGDWRGGTFTGSIAMGSSRFFPFQSYFIQNIEIPVTYKYGSTLKNFFTFNMSSKAQETDFDVIGSGAALFKLTDSNSLVRKWYDPTTDLMCYELSGTAIIDHIELNVSGYDVNSKDFDLPINSNMQVILTKCDLTLNKPMLIQPGAVVEIKPDANVTIATKIYLYDKDEWGEWISSKYYRSYGGDYPILTSHKNRGNGSSNKDMDDAIFMVDGTLTVSSGGLYSSAGGANVMGNGGGKVIFSTSLPSAGSVKWYKSTKTSGDGELGTTTMTAANLCNEDGFYTKSTKNTFHNVHGRWFVDGKQNEKTDHTFDFTYMAGENIGEENENRNTGADVNTDAVYSNDKTGLEARMKWFNVTSDCSGEDEEHVMHYWWKDANDYFYNWTMLSAWHQFIPTETEGLYSGSNNKLYTKTDVSTTCTWSELGETDVNCLYTIEDTKKALVDGHFIALEPNSDDAAFHEAADPTKYYICFEGCNWHAATKYEGEKKAYVVDETTFIWYEERWMAVEREEPFFYTKDETNVTIYYEYIGSEWVLAQPYVEVTDATETRQLLRFNEAITVASAKKNVTIKLLRDLVNITTPMTFTGANTTCTLDLNGHTAEVQVTGDGTTAVNMLTLNGAGSTFTITDNTAEKKGELKLVTSFTTENNTKRWRGIYLQNGSLVMANGKLHVENPIPYTKSTKLGYIEGILVASGKTLTINGGTIEVKSAYNPYGIETASGTPTVTINGGILETVATTNDSPYGIIGYGTINIKGGEVRAIANGSSSSRGVSVSAGSSYQGTVNVTGGTIYSEATGSAQGIYCGGTATVTGDYNATTPNNTPKARYYAKANISGGTITAVCRTSTTSYGVLSYGTTTISGGAITSTVQKSNQSTAYGVCTIGGTTTISGGANITANAPTKAYGVTATAANGDSNRGWPHVGVVNITGGTITANTTNTTTAYGLLVTGTTWTINLTNSYKVFNGDYAAAGTATVTGGTFKANAKTTLACGIAVAATKTKNDASATPQCTINGGYYQMTGTGDVLGCNASALAADFHINGGYYSHDGNLATYTPSPKHVLTLAAGDANRPPYYYKVAEAYQVTFKSEDGTANIIDPVYQEVGTTPVCSTEPTKESTSTNSFTFDGWATEANGAKVYEPNGLPNVTSAGATYYAHFATTTLKYRVHFDAATNGGECATENIYVDPGTAVGTLPTATKYGYTFNGWFTAASGGKQLTASTVINADADYYAQFTVNSHTLTWDLAGGTVGTAGKIGSTTWPAKNATGTQSRSVAYGTVLTTIPVVTKAGYVFNRWDPVPTSSMPDNNVTFTALWNPATNTKYYVKHYQQNIDDDNYTLVETDNLTGTTGATVTPDRKSYDGFLTPGPQQLTIGAAGTTELAYYYDRVVYTINWNASANGGACATTSTDVRHGANIALPAATKAGHILEGWYTKAEGGNKISEGATILQNYGTLYAQFVPTYTIIWNDENGNELSREEKLIGESLTPPDYSKTNTAEWTYTFHGWNDGTTTYAANAIPAVSGAATYTADVTKVKNNYTLTIGVVEAGYGSVNETSVTVPYGTSVSTSDNVLTIGTTTVTATPTASNAQYTYTFSTWQNVPTSVTGNVDNIQAVFTRTLNTVTVTWKNGDNTIETDEGVVIGAMPSFDGETPTKETDENFGYTFDGWDDGTTVYAADALPIVSGAVTYTAHYSTAPTVASVKVGSATTYYADFAEAWEATNSATGTVTLKLLQDVSGITTSLAYTNAQNCMLDLNNHTLSGTISKLIDVNATGKTFTIDDSSAEKEGKISMITSENARVYGLFITAGIVNLKHGTIYSQNTHAYSSAAANKNSAATGVYVTAGQTFTMDDGTVESESQYSSYALFIAQSTTSVVTINDGLIKGQTNASTTAGGIYNYSKKLTINGGHIIGHAYSNTSYGINLLGEATINGGIIEATNDTIKNAGSTKAYGIYTQYKSTTYKGVVTIPSTSTVKVIAKARTNTAYAVYIPASSTGSTIAGGTFTAIAKTGKTAAGLVNAGTITISGGKFTATAKTSAAYGIFSSRGTVTVNGAPEFNVSTGTLTAEGIYSSRGTVTVDGNPTFNVTAGTTYAYGVYAYGTIGAKGTGKYSGTINIKGGTFNVTSTQENAWGAYAGLYGLKVTVKDAENPGDTIAGQHYMPGIISITDGTFNVKAKTTKAYGLVLSKELNESGAVGTTLRSPKITVTGGKFKVESAGDANATAYAISSGNNASQATMQGGWYNVNANLSLYTAPAVSGNYHALDLVGEDPYKYEVAEAYTITFNNYDGTKLQSTAAKKGATPEYAGEDPTQTATEQYTYTFSGWDPAITTVTADATYTAQFNSTVNKYTITWVDGNDATLKTEQVAYGQTPAYIGETPTKTATAQYTYTFNNTWSPALASVTGDATYTAQFNSTVNKYDITWVDGNGETLKTEKVEYGQTPNYTGETPGKKMTTGVVYTFKGWTPEPTTVTDNATYTATFLEDKRPYPVLWVDWDGHTLAYTQRSYGDPAPPASQNTSIPTRASENGKVYTFSGWSDPVSVVEGGDVTYTALYRVDLLANEPSLPVEINEDTEVVTTTVRVSGALHIANNAKLTTTDLILEAGESQSGEILGNVLANNVYFDLAIEADRRHWNVFGVPFEIGDLDNTKLQYKNSGETTWHDMILGTHYDITYHDEATRASRGPVYDCWKYIEDLPAGNRTLQPGVAYSISLLFHVDTLRFTKKSGSPIHYSENVDLVNSNTDDATNGGWNGIANPATYHTLLATGVDMIQIHDGGEIGHDTYDPYPIASYKFVVGKAGYVQVHTTASVLSVDTAGNENPIPPVHGAPRRSNGITASELYTVELSAENMRTDRVYVKADEDKADEYTIGSDVMKLSTSQARPQIWVEQYNVKLCKSTMAPVNGQTVYPLGLYAPVAGEYTITNNQSAEVEEENTLYLTYDGLPIWNLTDAPYSIQLEKGTSMHYGLLLVRNYAPSVTTGTEEIQTGLPAAQKVIWNDQVYILRGGEVYTATGKKVQ